MAAAAAGTAVAAGLNDFERERLATIARNKAMLQQLTSDIDTSALREAPKPQIRPQKPRAPRAPAVAREPARRSGRHAGKERPDYRSQQELVVYVEYSPRRPRRGGTAAREGRGGGCRSRIHQQYPAWNPTIPDAPAAAKDRACEAAADRIEQLSRRGRHAYAKVMSDSQVSGGFWCQAPSELQAHLAPDSGVAFTCVHGGRQGPEGGFRNTQAARGEGERRDDAWTVGLLLKKDKDGRAAGGVGFSRNWRGFAIDQFLHPGDVVVIEVAGAAAANIHIFRAWDFASSQPPELEARRFAPLPPDGAAEQEGGPAPTPAAAAARGSAARAASSAEAASGERRGDGEQDADTGSQGSAGCDSGDVGPARDQDGPNRQHAAGSAGACQQQGNAGGKWVVPSRAGSTDAPSPKQQQQQEHEERQQQAAPAAAVAAAAAGATEAARKRKRQADSKPAGLRAAVGPEPASGTKRNRVQARQGDSGAAPGRTRKQPSRASSSAGRKQQQQQQQQQQPEKEKEKARQEKKRGKKQEPAGAPGQQGGEQQQGEEEDFEVDWILDTVVEGGVRLFKVRWLGYGEEYDTWEPASSFPLALGSYDWRCPKPASL